VTRITVESFASCESIYLARIEMAPTLPEVQTAKTLMADAMTWSVMKWLREKKNVRKAADLANAALDQLEERIRGRWEDEFRQAYTSLTGNTRKPASNGKGRSSTPTDSERLIKQIKEADDEAYRARMDAEKTFDQAERQLSTRLAREGCEKAIRAWDLKEIAIKRAEAVSAPNK